MRRWMGFPGSPPPNVLLSRPRFSLGEKVDPRISEIVLSACLPSWERFQVVKQSKPGPSFSIPHFSEYEVNT